jgi:hypothetical protein
LRHRHLRRLRRRHPGLRCLAHHPLQQYRPLLQRALLETARVLFKNAKTVPSHRTGEGECSGRREKPQCDGVFFSVRSNKKKNKKK